MPLPRRFPTDDPRALKRELEQLSDAAAAADALPVAARLDAVVPVAYADTLLTFGSVTRMNPGVGTLRANLPTAANGERRMLGLVKMVATGTLTLVPPDGKTINGAGSVNKTAVGLYLIWYDDSGYWCTT